MRRDTSEAELRSYPFSKEHILKFNPFEINKSQKKLLSEELKKQGDNFAIINQTRKYD